NDACWTNNPTTMTQTIRELWSNLGTLNPTDLNPTDLNPTDLNPTDLNAAESTFVLNPGEVGRIELVVYHNPGVFSAQQFNQKIGVIVNSQAFDTRVAANPSGNHDVPPSVDRVPPVTEQAFTFPSPLPGADDGFFSGSVTLGLS